jgi:uncharacterized protein
MAREWSCLKCGTATYDTDQFVATGGGITKMLDIQRRKFTTVSCTRCKYTGLYKAPASVFGNRFDLFIN